MKLYERLPDSVTVGRRRFRLDLDFRNVLRMMEIISREDLLADAREYLALRCITKPKGDIHALLAAVMGLLFPAHEKTASKEKITDFNQDADLIRAAFLQNYGINLFRDRLHWMEFSSLLSGLPEGSRYSEVLGIRARPMPAPTKYNAEERQWLARAKAEYAIHLTGKEQAQSLENSLRSVALSLLALAEQKGGGEHG